MSDGQANVTCTGQTTAIPVTIEIEADCTVNYAMQQNDVPVIKMLRITNTQDHVLRDLLVHVTAEPAFASSMDLRITAIDPGATYNLGLIDLQLAHDYLASLTERVVGAVHIDVYQGEVCLAHSSTRIDVLAYDEWNGLQSLPEIIAAFVTPNHPAIDGILSDSASILREWTGDPSLSGYQARDAQRVFHSVGAIYTALQRQHITYTNPPASFEERGQKIRLPDRILEHHLGTCLDLTVLLASCLEQMGLFPLIVLTEGHAFVGVWLEEDCFADVATDDLLRLRKRVELHDICVFETTLITAADPVPFAQAATAGTRHLDDINAFRCVIDICRARKCRIRPLPLRANNGAIIGVTTTKAAGDHTVPSSILPTFTPISVTNELSTLTEETPATRMDRWKRKLLDLSLRNKLLNFRESKKTLPILCPDLASLEDALADGMSFKINQKLAELGEVDDRNADVHRNRTGQDALDEQLRDEFTAHRLHADVTAAELDRRLREIYREAKLSLDENGANTLYLALGLLHWYESTSSEKHHLAPIILIPLNIDRRSVQEGYSITMGDDEPMINKTLLELLAKDFELTIPNVDPIPTDAHGINVSGILTSFRQAVKTIDRWEVLESAYIGHFSFTKFLMWRDIEVRADDLMHSKVVDHLVNTPQLPYPDRDGFPDADKLDDTHSPDETFCPLSADSSQLAAVYASATEKSFVLHGPPGTGKSQTIANIIAHNLAIGKTVLFVSEKRAALDVVYRRLVECGLGPFCLELHSNKSQRQAVLQQLQQPLEYIGSAPSETWQHEASRLAAARSELNRYVRALHLTRETGESVFQGVSRLIGLHDVPSVKLRLLATRTLDRVQLDELRDVVAKLCIAANEIEHPHTNVWASTDYPEWSLSIESSIRDILRQTTERQQKLELATRSVSELLGLPTEGWSRQVLCTAMQTATHMLELLPRMPASLLRSNAFGQLTDTIRTWTDMGRMRNQLRAEVYAHFSPRVLSLDLMPLQEHVTKATTSWLTPDFVAKRETATSENWMQWVGCEVRKLLMDLTTAATALQEKTKSIVPFIGIAADSLPVAGYGFLEQLCDVLLGVPAALPTALLTEPDWETTRLTIQDWIAHGRHRDALRETLYARYTEQLLRLDLDGLDQKMIAANGSWFLPRTFGQMAVRKAMRGVNRNGAQSPTDGLLADIEQAIALRTEEAAITEVKSKAAEWLGIHWKDGEADWDAIEQLLAWCGTLRNLIAVTANSDTTTAAKLRTRLATFLRENRDRCLPEGDLGQQFQAMRDAHQTFMHAYHGLSTCFTLDLAMVWGDQRTVRLDVILANVLEWQQQIEAIQTVYTVSNHDTIPPVETFTSDLLLAIQLQTIEQQLSEATPEAVNILGEHWHAGEADWESIEGLLEGAQRLRDDAQQLAASTSDRALMLLTQWAELSTDRGAELAPTGSIGAKLTALAQAYAALQESITALEQRLSLDTSTAWVDSRTANYLNTIATRVQTWIEHLPTFRSWCYWRAMRHQAISQGLHALIEAFEAQQIAPNEFADTFNRGYYEEWIEKMTSTDPALSSFFSREFERKIEQFREIDQRYMQLTQAEICARIATKLPRNAGTDSPNSEMGILRHQLGLKKSRLAVRQLIKQIPHLLPRLKPCLLMSPISVAQYLDAEHPPFDLIVFDEASQIPPWDAIGAIARGSEVVIVGDPKQLPPTNFFSRADDGDEDAIDESTVEDLESILDNCIAAQLPEQHLRWHYRSRHESLIAFSNCQYYDNNLLTFPSPHQQMGVSFHHVAGTYDKGKSRTNRAEADAVVAEIVQRLHDPELSRHTIGVVTFSMAQQVLIEDLLDDAQRQYPEIEEFFGSSTMEPLFVKNLENVQGDERDVILFSICYGPDAQGRVAMNFGPLNRDGGERRLNVAITRARREVIVFSTLRPEQINLAKTRARGVADLKCFLDYAERGPMAISERLASDPVADGESPFEEHVCAMLRERGYDVHAQVGCSGYRIDLAIVDPDLSGRYLLGIECDGANYHRAKTARDRDRLREGVLRGLGWQLHRVWSTDWWRNPKEELSRIEFAIEKAHRNRKSHEEPPKELVVPRLAAAPLISTHTSQKSVASALPPCQGQLPLPPSAPVYQPYQIPRVLGDLETFYQPVSSTDCAINTALQNVVNHEGPISISLAARRVAAHWGIKRVTEKALARIEKILPYAKIHATHTTEGTFLWPAATDPAAYAIYRAPGTTDDAKRSAEDLPPEEVANAALQVLEQQISIPMADLIRATAHLFGFERIGQNVERAMRAGIALLPSRGKAIEQGEKIIHQQ